MREAEREARGAEERQTDENDGLRAGPGGEHPGRDGAGERAHAERGGEHPGARLREPESVRIVRQERRKRRVEERVHEHDRADEGQEPPHPDEVQR